MEEALGDLIRISRAIGSDPDLAQGGGGNTSVKSRDGRRLFVKASGTALAAMDAARGWAELDLEAAREILSSPGLGELQWQKREAAVLRLLQAAVRRPKGARPSVESSLHAVLDRVVIHTHPVGLNAFLSSRRSRGRYRELLGRWAEDALYVPYTDPGYVLGVRVAREVAAYRRRRGRGPSVVLLENHGLFVTAGGVEECLRLSRAVTALGRRFIGGGRVNRFQFAPLSAPSARGAGKSAGAAGVREALIRGGAGPLLIHREAGPLARALLNRPAHLRGALRGAFTPDQIVYCRTRPLLLPKAGGAVAEAWKGRAAQAVAAYRRRTGLDPRVLIVPREGIYYAALDLPQLRAVAEVYRSALAALVFSRRAGGPRLLTSRAARFIEEWEVEAYRARLLDGKGRPLAGRIALVAGALSPHGRVAARWLAESGATVVLLDRNRSELDLLARALGSSCLAFPGDPRDERAVERAQRRVATAMGGVDLPLQAIALRGL